MIHGVLSKLNKRNISYLSKIDIRKLFALISFIFAATIIITFSVSVYKTTYETVYKERVDKLIYVADFAYEILEYQNSLVKAHKKSLKEAQKESIEMIKNVRFEYNDYIWINKYDGIMVYHPFTERIGEDVSLYKDSRNNPFGAKFINMVKKYGKGYVEYYWPKINKDNSESFEKVSYVLGYKDWNWIIGTGLYIDDLNNKVIKLMYNAAIPVLLIFIIMFMIFRYIVFASIIVPIEELAEKSLELADNNLGVELPTHGEKTEFGKLYGALNKFINVFKEKKNNEEKLSLILENMTDCLVITDIHGHIKAVNPSIIKMFGCSPEEVIGKSMDMLTSPSLFSGSPDDFEGIKYVGDKYQLMGIKNGSFFPIEVDVNELPVGNEDLFFLLIRNITGQKEIEKIKNQFVFLMDRELNPPLIEIRSSLEFLLNNRFQNLDENLKKLILSSYNNADNLVEIINDILEIEKLSEEKITLNFDHENLLDTINELLMNKKQLGQRYGVEYKFIHNLHPETLVKTDKLRLFQILSNLISNATKISNEESIVEITAELKKYSYKISIRTFGKGFSKECCENMFEIVNDIDKILEPGRKGGFGVRTYIAKLLVDKMNGKIEFESEIDKGTTFYVELPRYIE